MAYLQHHSQQEVANQMIMKIAYIIDTIESDTAGTQKQLLETIRRLDRTEFDPSVICLWRSPWMQSNPLPCNCTVLGYKGFLKINFPFVVRRLARLLSDEKIDIAQTFFEDSIFVVWLAAALSSRRPVLLSSRRDMGLGVQNQPWYHQLFRLALPLVNRRFAGIIANSSEVRHYVSRRERTPLSKIKIHYNGVALPALRENAATAPGSMAGSTAALWIGLVGNLTPVKRHDLLIQAFKVLMMSMPELDARLLLLGDGPQRASLELLAAQLGVRERIHFEGSVHDVSPYLRHLDIGVLCSDREGLSNAILEYMAHGIPVIATAVGGNSELIDRNNGIIVPPGDVDALAEALNLLSSDPQRRASLGQASREKAQRLFSWERSIADIETYYRGLLPTTPTAPA